MAHIILRPSEDGWPAMQLIINGHDFSNETFKGSCELVSVGDEPDAEVGLRVTFALSRLDLGGDADIQVTNHLHTVAQKVQSMQDAS